LELVDPGLVHANDWRPDDETPNGSPAYNLLAAGQGRKTMRQPPGHQRVRQRGVFSRRGPRRPRPEPPAAVRLVAAAGPAGRAPGRPARDGWVRRYEQRHKAGRDAARTAALTWWPPDLVTTMALTSSSLRRLGCPPSPGGAGRRRTQAGDRGPGGSEHLPRPR
jgi:hypothetical protein